MCSSLPTQIMLGKTSAAQLTPVTAQPSQSAGGNRFNSIFRRAKPAGGKVVG